MKFTSPTKRKEFLRCPKRYHYRYLHVPDTTKELIEHRRRQQLYGVRELGGHLIHVTAAQMIRAIAAGDRSWDYSAASASCLRDFTTIVAKSLAGVPGEWIGGTQLAETFNGASPGDIQDDVNHWRVLIPTCIENAWRAATSFHLKQETPDYTIESEKPVSWKRESSTHRYVFDVLVRSKYRVVVIDWKTHEIDNADVSQVRQYLDYLHRNESIPASKLTGFAVDLRREEIIPVSYDPYRTLFTPHLSKATTSSKGEPESSSPGSYAANPHPKLCLRCPYANRCPESAQIPKPAKSATAVSFPLLNLGSLIGSNST